MNTKPYSWGSSEYLVGEVKLEFSGWPGLEINILVLVHRFAILKHMVTRINDIEKKENREEINYCQGIIFDRLEEEWR